MAYRNYEVSSTPTHLEGKLLHPHTTCAHLAVDNRAGYFSYFWLSYSAIMHINDYSLMFTCPRDSDFMPSNRYNWRYGKILGSALDITTNFYVGFITISGVTRIHLQLK